MNVSEGNTANELVAQFGAAVDAAEVSIVALAAKTSSPFAGSFKTFHFDGATAVMKHVTLSTTRVGDRIVGTASVRTVHCAAACTLDNGAGRGATASEINQMKNLLLAA